MHNKWRYQFRLKASVFFLLFPVWGMYIPVVCGKSIPFSTITIRGKVLNKQTNHPVAYTSIGIKSKPIGTITNEAGEFAFHFPSSFKNDTLLISCLGYTPYQAVIKNLPVDEEITIYLTEQTYALNEVVVRSKALTAEEIVKLAKKRITENYPTKPYKLTGYFRKYQKVNGRYIFFTDAAVDIYDNGYQHVPFSGNQLQEKLVLQAARLSDYHNFKGFINFNDADWSDFNSLRHILLQNAVRYRSKMLHTGQYDYQIDSLIKQDHHLLYVITAKVKHKKYISGKRIDNTRHPAYVLFIDTENFAIHKIIYQPVPLEINTLQDVQDLVMVAGNDSIQSYFEGSKLRVTIEYKPYQDILFPYHILLQGYVNDYSLRTHTVAYINEYLEELLINDFAFENAEQPEGSVLDFGTNLESQVPPYDAQFWKNYNAIKLTALDSQMIADLNKGLSLEDQFRGKRKRQADPKEKFRYYYIRNSEKLKLK